MSGLPLTVTSGGGTGAAGGTPLNMPDNTQTANQVAAVQILGGIGPNGPWFSPSSFVQPTAAGVYGNTGRNIFDGPGFFNLDASLAKVIRYRECYSLEVRGEAFSITNTLQFDLPNRNVSNASNFGYVSATVGGNHILQLGAKFNF